MNQTIYFRKTVWESFKDEPNKSELINNLLEDWYSGKIKNPMPANRKPYVEFQPAKYPEPSIEPLAAIAVDKAPSNEPGAISKVNVIEKIPKPRNNAGFCQNGHPIPDGRSKCMGKGCKYS